LLEDGDVNFIAGSQMDRSFVGHELPFGQWWRTYSTHYGSGRGHEELSDFILLQ